MRKNILIFGHGYAKQFIDVNNQYTQLFDKNKYAVTVVYLVGAPSEQIREQHLAENVIFLNYPGKVTRGLKIPAIKKMLSLCREKKFSIVICHRYKPTYIMLWIEKLQRIPALFFVMHEMKTMRAVTRKLLIASLARKNMLFAGVSNAVRDDMRRDMWRISKEKIITLYNMIDVESTENKIFSRSAARKQFNLPDDVFVFGTIGRLAKAKDHRSLIHAFALIKPQCPTAKLVIMGEGELEAESKAFAATFGLSEDVIFTGYVPDAFRYTKLFDTFILSSIKEAFGRVLLEAMVARTPIIATRVNGIPEVLGNTGILVDPANPAMLASAMLKTYQLSTQELSALGTQGYQRAVKDFSTQKFREIFWELPILGLTEPLSQHSTQHLE